MNIGEVGAGTGRYTFPIAKKVGNKGIVYANDIDIQVLKELVKNSINNKINNIKTILGEEKDPCFPIKNLDVVFIIFTLHHLKYKEDMLKNILPYLKKTGLLVITEELFPINFNKDVKRKSIEYSDEKIVIAECVKSGYKLVKIEPYDDINIYVFSISQ